MSCQKLSGQTSVSPSPPSNHLPHCRGLRAGGGCFTPEFVWNTHANLSAQILLPSKKAEAGMENKGLDEDPA